MQACLSLCWSHEPHCWKSHVAAHKILVISCLYAKEQGRSSDKKWIIIKKFLILNQTCCWCSIEPSSMRWFIKHPKQRGYSNFWNEYAIYFDWSEKCIFHEWLHEWNIHFLMKYTFSRFTRWNKWHIHSKNFNFLFIIYNFKGDRFFALKESYTFTHYVILMTTLNDVQCRQNWNHRSRSKESENFSKSPHIYYQNIPCNLTKKMNTHTLCFCSLIRKLQAFEILKWA